MTRRSTLLLAGILISSTATFSGFLFVPGDAKPAEAARLNNLGAAYMNQQLFEKALTAFEQAAALDPKLAMARLNQGVALLNLGKVATAKPLLEEAAKLDASDLHAWYNLGLLHKNDGEVQAAINAFRHVTEIDPNDADSWYFLGAAYSESKQYREAMDAFQRTLKINPEHASAEFGMARALQISGELRQAREHLTRFQYITEHRLGSAITLAYGEQGKYSLAEESPLAPEKVPGQIKVRFVDFTAQANLGSKGDDHGDDFPSWLAPGACFLDYDNDGRIDLLLSANGAQSGLSLYRNLGGGKFQDVTAQVGLDPSLHAIGCAAGDFDNDGLTDLVVTAPDRILLLHNEKGGRLKDITAASGIRASGVEVGVTWFDYDHDGDLDLFETQTSSNPCLDPRKPVRPPCGGVRLPNFQRLWRNNGNGTFSESQEPLGQSNAPEVAAMGVDFNNDRATDLVVTGSFKGGPVIFENPREGRFKARVPWLAPLSVSFGTTSLDFNHDGWMDLAFAHAEPPAITLWRNNQSKHVEGVALATAGWTRAFGITAIDYDNDGWVDLVAAGETAEGKGEVRLFRSLGPDGFKDVTADVGLDKVHLQAPRAVIVGDFDNDGATDLLITQNRGPAVLLRNEGGNENHWLRLNLTGLADNKNAIGTKVEIFSDGNRQKFEIAGSSGYLGQNSPYLTVGLGKARQADIVRMLWPTGVLQDEIEAAADRVHKFMEIDRRGSSCPTLFAWDGQQYKLVADMLGAGVVGHWVAPGQRNLPRPSEYLKLNRDSLREKDTLLSFRFMEPLEEAVYLDQVELLAVDHPGDVDVFPNEYFASNPPYPPFKVVFSQNAHPPAAVKDDHGHDLLPDLLAHRFVGDFEVLPFAGFTRLHSLELDLGQTYRGGPLWLLMHGEIEYFSATGMYAADQAGLQPITPFLEALGADGKWTRVMDDLGFPAGGPRTMTADLTGKLPLGTSRVRITTNLQIYWDSILIDRAVQDRAFRVTRLPLTHADLRYHGFPRKIEGRPPGNVEYIYEQASATGPYTRPAGAYTRYGDVQPLLTGLDDRLAVFASGDEIALDFNPAHLPALPTGWVRDYFYAALGYEKDMDFYAYRFDRVDPLPFGGMGKYPYPGKSFPLDDDHLKYLLEYNTRYMSGNEARGYAFDYASSPAH